MCENNEIKPEDITFTSTKNDDDFLVNEDKTLRQYTCNIIKHYLKKNNSDVVATAKALDIGKSTIYKMIQDEELRL
jgi:transcriptional regulator with PAS, ATPase and Fis domain